MDVNAELAALKAQMATLMGAMKGEEEITVKSVWAIHSSQQQAVWCSKSDCPKLGRKITYDVVKKDKDLEEIIQTGISEEAADAEDVEKKVRRVGGPTIKLHNLGVLAAFSTKIKAQNFMKDYFRANQDAGVGDLLMTEIKVIA